MEPSGRNQWQPRRRARSVPKRLRLGGWQLNDPRDEAVRRRSPVSGVFGVSLGEPGLLADRLQPEDHCEDRRRGEDERGAMQGKSEAENKETSVKGVTGSCVDARASKCRTVTRSRQRSKRPAEGDPAQDQHPRARCFEHEAEGAEPGLNAGRPARAWDGASDHRDEDDRLQDDPAFSASSQRRRVHGMTLTRSSARVS
jgi:hypothetical protein